MQNIVAEPSLGTAYAAPAPACYPETRIGAFDFSAATCTEPLGYGSADGQRACGDSWPGMTEDLFLFIQEDPKRWADSARNLYRMVENRPLDRIDPTGEDYVPVSPIWNLDPRPYPASGDTGRNSPGRTYLIPKRRDPAFPFFPIPFPPFPMLPIPVPSTPPWYDNDHICTDDGWRKAPIGGFLLGGRLCGPFVRPDPDWTPPFPCPIPRCPR